MAKTYFRQFYFSKRTIIIYILIGCIPVLFSLDSSRIIGKNIYDLYFDIFSNYSSTFLFIPLFVFLIENNSNFFDDTKVITRFENKLDWWNKRLSVSAIECLCFAIITNIVLYFYIIINGKGSDINFEFVFFVLKNSLLHFLGCLVIITCFIVARCKFNRTYIGIMVVLFVVFIDFILFVTRCKVNIILDKIYIYSNYVEVVNLNLFIARSVCFLCAVFLSLSILGYKIFKGKDIL